MLFHRETWLSFIVVLFSLCFQRTNTHCSRPLSRIVRNQLTEHFYNVFEAKHVAPHSECPLLNSTDLYRIQEGNKTSEYASRWQCNFCGKAFFSEHFLDVHFDNKHSDMLVKGSTVCLADFCDIFRCDVFVDQRRDRFWEKKLCKEDKLAVRRKRCEALMRSCLPQGNLSVDEELEIYEAIRDNTCSLLNCKDYWKPTYEEIAAWKIILYAMVTPFFCMGLIVYYYAVWDHYHGDYPYESSTSHEEEQNFSRYRNYGGTSSNLRKRYGDHGLMY